MVAPSTPLDLPLVSYTLLPASLHSPQSTDNLQFIQFGYNHKQEWQPYTERKQGNQSTRYLRWLRELKVFGLFVWLCWLMRKGNG